MGEPPWDGHHDRTNPPHPPNQEPATAWRMHKGPGPIGATEGTSMGDTGLILSKSAQPTLDPTRNGQGGAIQKTEGGYRGTV